MSVPDIKIVRDLNKKMLIKEMLYNTNEEAKKHLQMYVNLYEETKHVYDAIINSALNDTWKGFFFFFGIRTWRDWQNVLVEDNHY